MSVSDIQTFFQQSSRDENDATNKIREKVLEILSNPPADYFQHPEFGHSWRTVSDAWTRVLQKVAEKTDIPEYTTTEIKLKGGRCYNYDADVIYKHGVTVVAIRKIEFKNGGTNIGALPQFLSLQAKVALFPVTYDVFYYEHYLDRYLACDKGLTEPKPTLATYCKHVTSTKYTITPFFAQLKSRELFFQNEKNAVVNASITDYLTRYGSQINHELFSEKVRATQTDKVYLLWSNGSFHIDSVTQEEMTGLTFHGIRNGNVLELKSGKTIYGLLLRWRNHKGILNPAWQISMKRLD